MTPIISILLFSLSAPAVPQEASISVREARYAEFLRAPRLVRGGDVRARWLDDGSSFWYWSGPRMMFVDPAVGVPREATRADREREPEEKDAIPGVRVEAPAMERSAFLEQGNLAVSGEGLEEAVLLTDDASEDVVWSLETGCWSHDGSLLVSTRMDARDVHRIPLVDFAEAEETVRLVRYIKTGGRFPELQLIVFRVPEGTRTEVDLGTEDDLYVFPLGWREDDSELLYLRMTRDAKQLALMGADPATGASRVILSETQETFVGGLDFVTGGWRDVFTPVEGTDRFLWFSERDGWRHLYQYDYDGALVGRVTEGAFPVLGVAGVDPARDAVFVTANAEERLYDTHLYRVPLGGGRLARLTDGTGEHRVQLSPCKRWFVDTHSSLDRPPRSELRDVQGTLVCTLGEADVSGLDAMGWVVPERFVVQAADGETDLYGVLFKPADFDPGQRYPVIDYIYSGPFISVAPNDFTLSTHLAPYAQAMAQMGFVTFIVDPRGTTERSKAFQDASYGRIGEIEIPDHVATLHQLAAERPYLDLDRVGVYGHSWGGYFALRAMLTAPEVFHAGVAGAPGELTEAAPINEPYMGLPSDNPEGYAAGLNAPLAANLEGELLLIHGTADVNAPFSTTMRMVAALVEADRQFDLLVLPGAAHSFRGAQLRHAEKRIRSFFLEHLRGERREK